MYSWGKKLVTIRGQSQMEDHNNEPEGIDNLQQLIHPQTGVE